MRTIVATVALPAYNSLGTIGECLTSLEAQTFPREQMQIVVGDNGSSDGTREMIGAQFPRVQVVPASERGSGYARNAAFAQAQGPYICSIDADCVADAGWIAAMVAAFERSPDTVGCLGGRIEPYQVQSRVERYRHAWVLQGLGAPGAPVRYAATLNAAFRRDALDQVGLFDGTQGFDDTDMGLRLSAAGYEIDYVPQAIVRHRHPATLRELYRHRVKYGLFQVRLARKHPAVFSLPETARARRRATYLTARRIAGDLLYKLPRALLLGDGGQGTRLWPLLDAALALGLHVGERQGWKESLPKRAQRGTKPDAGG